MLVKITQSKRIINQNQNNTNNQKNSFPEPGSQIVQLSWNEVDVEHERLLRLKNNIEETENAYLDK